MAALLPHSDSVLRKLQEKNSEIAIASNQSIIGRGIACFEQVKTINSKVLSLLSQFGVSISKVCICHQTALNDCSCWKPKPKMGFTSMEVLGYTNKDTIVVFYKIIDIDLVKKLVARSILLS